MNSSRRRKLRLWETFHGTLMLPVTFLFIAAAIATGLLTFYHERWHAHHQAAQQLDILADTVKANVERFLKDCRYDTLHQTRWLSLLPALKEATGTGPQARTARDELSRILRRICEERGLYDDILFVNREKMILASASEKDNGTPYHFPVPQGHAPPFLRDVHLGAATTRPGIDYILPLYEKEGGASPRLAHLPRQH